MAGSRGVMARGKLYAAFDHDDEAARAEGELQGLDPAVASHRYDAALHTRRGLVAAMERFVLRLSDDDVLGAHRYAVHASSGRIVLIVPMDSHDDARRVATVLRTHGAHDIAFVGSWTAVHFYPSRP